VGGRGGGGQGEARGAAGGKREGIERGGPVGALAEGGRGTGGGGAGRAGGRRGGPEGELGGSGRKARKRKGAAHRRTPGCTLKKRTMAKRFLLIFTERDIRASRKNAPNKPTE